MTKPKEELKSEAAKVSIYGMFNTHTFHKFEGFDDIDRLVTNWIIFNTQEHPDIIAGEEVDDIGAAELCPAIVLDEDGNEIRRVGEMVYWHSDKPNFDQDKLQAYVLAIKNDPDIPRLLKIQYTETNNHDR